MRVLLPAVDIFHSVGGGQSFYKQLIQSNPNIEFSYLIRNESDKANRPSNSKTINYDYKFPNLHVLNPILLIKPLLHLQGNRIQHLCQLSAYC